MTRVVVVGSSNFDRTAYLTAFPKPGETVLTPSVESAVGGKGANQAIAAATLGASVDFVTALGDDAEGKQIEAALDRAGIRLHRLVDAAGQQTGSAFITVDEHGENTIVVASGVNAEHTREATVAALSVVDSDAVVVSQAEVPVETIELTAERCRETGARFVLNLAPYVAIDREVLALADPLVVNRGEAAALVNWLEGEQVEQLDEADELVTRLSEYCRSVVITLGGDGAVCVANGTTHRVPATKVDKVVDTTGAGDAFVGFAARMLASGEDLHAAVEAASRLAAVTVQHRGASASYAACTADQAAR